MRLHGYLQRLLSMEEIRKACQSSGSPAYNRTLSGTVPLHWICTVLQGTRLTCKALSTNNFHLTHSRRQMLAASKLKEFVDNNFKVK